MPWNDFGHGFLHQLALLAQHENTNIWSLGRFLGRQVPTLPSWVISRLPRPEGATLSIAPFEQCFMTQWMGGSCQTSWWFQIFKYVVRPISLMFPRVLNMNIQNISLHRCHSFPIRLVMFICFETANQQTCQRFFWWERLVTAFGNQRFKPQKLPHSIFQYVILQKTNIAIAILWLRRKVSKELVGNFEPQTYNQFESWNT